MTNSPQAPKAPKSKWLIAGVLLFFALCMYVGIFYKVSKYGP